ncbi:hypothetical protein KJ359_007892 [Pestalotiopsis sp. 9143b]|nr:hypothetical protein KJ359_007892 [Pestalotiopsis sp. 9143b]
MILWRRLFLLGFSPVVLSATNDLRAYDYGHTAQDLLGTRDVPGNNESQNALVQAISYNGSIPLRLELRDLQNKHEQWNLYILALSWIQWLDQNDPNSWYSIAGIHGAPFADYGGQTLYNTVQTIAAWYPDEQREAFQKAADGFRIPYWDWAMTPANGSHVFPDVLWNSSQIEVNGPNGKQNISNPLFNYVFKPLNPGMFEEYPFMYWNETMRNPQPSMSPNATSDNQGVVQDFDTRLPTIQQRLHNLFTKSGNYSEWSNEAWITDPNDTVDDSIESLHDLIHLMCGGNWGHMAIIAYSSFDPAFFLHHASLDRLFAMWQVVYNDSWVEPSQAVLPTRTIRTGDNQTSLSDLTPFYHNGTHFWNSDEVRDHKVFGYSYAGVVSGNRSDVNAVINRLYGGDKPTMSSKRNARVAQRNSSSRPPKKISTDIITGNDVYREWIANIRVNKFALGASFTIHLFFGRAPKYSGKWMSPESSMGMLGVFAGGHAHGDMDPLQVSGTIPLTSALAGLVSSGELSSMEPVDINPFLEHNIGLAVMHSNGSVVSASAVDGLHISIVSSLVTAPKTETELASWGEVDIRFDLY